MGNAQQLHSLTQLAAAMHLAGHPLRVVILGHLISGGASPNGLFKLLAGGEDDVTLGKLAYHFRQLAEEGKIRLDHVEPVRGTEEHFYELAEPGCALLRTIGLAGESLDAYVTRGLRDRGWEVDDALIDPEGNRYASLGAAIDAQGAREAAAAQACGCQPALIGRDGQPSLADVHDELATRAQAMRAGPYEMPDANDANMWTAGSGLAFDELVAAGQAYADRWAHDDQVPVEHRVAGANIHGMVAGALHARAHG